MRLIEQRRALWKIVEKALYEHKRREEQLYNLPETKFYPVARNYIVHSLLHLSRMAIRKSVTVDKLSSLQIPAELVGYLLEKAYLLAELGSPPIATEASGITKEKNFGRSWIPQPPTLPPRSYRQKSQ